MNLNPAAWHVYLLWILGAIIVTLLVFTSSRLQGWPDTVRAVGGILLAFSILGLFALLAIIGAFDK